MFIESLEPAAEDAGEPAFAQDVVRDTWNVELHKASPKDEDDFREYGILEYEYSQHYVGGLVSVRSRSSSAARMNCSRR
jgi:hypothetical protein